MTASPAHPLLPRRAALLLALPLVLAVLAWWRTLAAPFVYDDQHAVEQNAAIKSFDAFFARPDLLRPGARAVTELTFAANYALGRLDPLGYHVVGLLVHLGVVVLLYRLTRELLGRAGVPSPEGTAVAVAGAFALHPLHSQAVAYVAQRSETLASLFGLAMLLLLLSSQRGEERPRRLALRGVAFACFLLALYAKMIAVALPAAWLLLAWAFPRDPGEPAARRMGKELLAAAPFLAVTGWYVATSIGMLGGSGEAGFSVPGLSVREYLFTQAHVIWRYARLLALPAGLNVDPDFPITRRLDVTTAAAGLAILGAAAAALALLALRPRAGGWWPALRVGAAGVLWFLLGLAPTSSIVPIVDVIQEHRTYLPSYGLLLAAGALLATAAARLPPRPRAAVPALVALVCAGEAVALHARNAVWESPLALWSDAASKSPAKVRPNANLASALERAGRLEEAVTFYRRAVALPPDPVTRPQDLLRNLGATLAKLGRLPEAADALGAALAIDPADTALLNNLAICRLDMGDPRAAAAAARRAAEIDPRNGAAQNTLGEALLALGDAEGALRAFQRGAELDPDVAVRHFNVAAAAQRLGRLDEACDAAGRLAASVRTDFDRRLLAEVDAELRCRGR